MMTKKTLALIAVASMAPTSRKAARPAKSWQASQDAKTTKAVTTMPTIRSPRRRWPNSRQIAS